MFVIQQLFSDYEKIIRTMDGDGQKVTFPPARARTVEEIHAVADGFAAGAKRANGGIATEQSAEAALTLAAADVVALG